MAISVFAILLPLACVLLLSLVGTGVGAAILVQGKDRGVALGITAIGLVCFLISLCAVAFFVLRFLFGWNPTL